MCVTSRTLTMNAPAHQRLRLRFCCEGMLDAVQPGSAPACNGSSGRSLLRLPRCCLWAAVAMLGIFDANGTIASGPWRDGGMRSRRRRRQRRRGRRQWEHERRRRPRRSCSRGCAARPCCASDGWVSRPAGRSTSYKPLVRCTLGEPRSPTFGRQAACALMGSNNRWGRCGTGLAAGCVGWDTDSTYSDRCPHNLE